MRADSSVQGDQGRGGKEVTQSAALVVLSIVGVALALIVEACCVVDCLGMDWLHCLCEASAKKTPLHRDGCGSAQQARALSRLEETA